MTLTQKRQFKKLSVSVVKNVLLILMGFVMIYPLIWLFFASFKTNAELFGSINLFPQEFIWTSYRDGWNLRGHFNYGQFFANTFMLVIPTVVFTIMSSTFTAYGFARFNFPGRNLLFSLMIGTLMLPNAVMILPRFILFQRLGWINSYRPFIIPALFATSAFFVFLMIQFFRGLPRALDEAATIDGCGSFGVFIRIILPLSKPAIFSVAIFQFLWTWNDFFNALIYINSTSRFPISLALRLSLDTTAAAIAWNQVLAMAVLSIIPPTMVFFFAQKYFVEGIVTSGIKM